LKLKNRENELELSIDEKLLDRIGQIALKHYPNEFGGFLIGHYSTDFKLVEIKDVLLPKKYKGTPTLFERSTDNMEEAFAKLFIEKQQYYIGEWHSHPDGSTMYSNIDLNAMRKTVECETVHIKNPLLLIISAKKNEMAGYTFYCYNDKKLISYE
jgi:proteasome lid subunit RPN8/RPN11